jgi:hypothetical protein
MRAAGKQDLSVYKYGSIIVEKGAFVKNLRRIEGLKVI